MVAIARKKIAFSVKKPPKIFRPIKLSTASHKFVVEQMILTVNIFSLVVCIVSFTGVPFLRIQFRQHNPSFQEVLSWRGCTDDEGLSAIMPWLHKSFIYTKDTVESLRRKAFTVLAGVRTEWKRFQSIWILDFICCIAAIVYDTIRRTSRKRRRYDFSAMFSIGVMLVLIAFVRTCNIYLYYSIMSSVSDLMCDLNDAVQLNANSGEATSTKTVVVPYKYCLNVPKRYFVLYMTGVLLAVLNITLVLDFMDMTDD